MKRVYRLYVLEDSGNMIIRQPTEFFMSSNTLDQELMHRARSLGFTEFEWRLETKGDSVVPLAKEASAAVLEDLRPYLSTYDPNMGKAAAALERAFKLPSAGGEPC